MVLTVMCQCVRGTVYILKYFIPLQAVIGQFNKSNVVQRCMESYRQQYSSPQWSKCPKMSIPGWLLQLRSTWTA